MTPDEALIALAAGEEEDQERAKEVIFDHFFPRLVVLLERELFASPDAATTGVADALIELFRKIGDLIEKSIDTPRQIQGWLIKRARQRTIDEIRRSGLHGLSKAEREQVRIIEFDEDVRDGIEDATIHDAEFASLVLAHAATLDQPDRGIVLGILLNADSLDGEDDEVDSEIIDCLTPWGIYTVEALRKRRFRLRRELQDRFRGFRDER